MARDGSNRTEATLGGTPEDLTCRWAKLLTVGLVGSLNVVGIHVTPRASFYCRWLTSLVRDVDRRGVCNVLMRQRSANAEFSHQPFCQQLQVYMSLRYLFNGGMQFEATLRQFANQKIAE